MTRRGLLPIRALAWYVLMCWPDDTARRADIRELLPNRNAVTESLRQALRMADRAGLVVRDGDVVRVLDRKMLREWALTVAEAGEDHPQLVAIRRATQPCDLR